MTKRLFVYDFVTLYRRVIRAAISLLILSLISLGILLISGLIPATAGFSVALNNALTVVFYAVIIASAVLLAYCTAQLLIHFYQTVFGEEGAFMRTLPATPDALLFSKLFSGAIWVIVILCLGIIAVILGALLPFEVLLRAENVSFLSNLARTVADEIGAFTLPALLFSLLSKLAVCYFAITLGAGLFPKRGVFGAILCLIVLLSVDASLHALLNAFTEPAFEWDAGFAANLPDIFSLLLSLLLGGGAVLGTRKIFSRRLSLYY